MALHESMGDESDMLDNGYVYTDEGLGYDHFWSYIDFEYYKGTFDDETAPLKAISAFLKEEISDMSFVTR